jgi:hypothetical protein
MHHVSLVLKLWPWHSMSNSWNPKCILQQNLELNLGWNLHWNLEIGWVYTIVILINYYGMYIIIDAQSFIFRVVHYMRFFVLLWCKVDGMILSLKVDQVQLFFRKSQIQSLKPPKNKDLQYVVYQVVVLTKHLTLKPNVILTRF